MSIPPGDEEGFKADMVGNLAFWPQQDIVEAMGAINGVAYNINLETAHTGETTESEDDNPPPLIPLT